MTERVELAHNAAGRAVPSMVNGKPQIPYLGVGKYQPRGRKQAPIPRTATSGFPISKRPSANAACAMAW
jgi:hypothetical protein